MPRSNIFKFAFPLPAWLNVCCNNLVIYIYTVRLATSSDGLRVKSAFASPSVELIFFIILSIYRPESMGTFTVAIELCIYTLSLKYTYIHKERCHDFEHRLNQRHHGTDGYKLYYCGEE